MVKSTGKSYFSIVADFRNVPPDENDDFTDEEVAEDIRMNEELGLTN